VRQAAQLLDAIVACLGFVQTQAFEEFQFFQMSQAGIGNPGAVERQFAAASGLQERRPRTQPIGPRPNGRLLLTGHTNQTVRVRDLDTGQELHRFQTPPRTGPRSLAFSPDGRFAAGGSFRGWVYLWRLPVVPDR